MFIYKSAKRAVISRKIQTNPLRKPIKIKVKKKKTHYLVARTELLYEEFNCHRSNERTKTQERGSKKRMGKEL